jgi:hypothetical protein
VVFVARAFRSGVAVVALALGVGADGLCGVAEALPR